MINVNNMSAGYEPESSILRGLNFHIAQGESVAIIGANGAGKSTLLSVLLGFLPYTGEVCIAGKTVVKENLEYIRYITGMLFQNPDDQIFQGKVAEDIAFGPRNYGIAEDVIKARSEAVLHGLGREDLLARYTYKLSFGEKKISALAGVLVMEPQVLLLDEPTSALDPRARKQFVQYLQQLPQTKLIVTHDLDMVFNLCTRVLLLDGGKIAQEGTPTEILTNKKLLEEHGLELPLCCASRM